MASAKMVKRVESMVDATYRAMTEAHEIMALSATKEHCRQAAIWTVRWSAVNHINQSMRLGYSDTALIQLFEALKPEMVVTMSMTGFAAWVRRLHPRPKTPTIVKIEAREQHRKIVVLRARQDYEIARNQRMLAAMNRNLV